MPVLLAERLCLKRRGKMRWYHGLHSSSALAEDFLFKEKKK
jgi:hypothetical protein